jgi:hypothetical protein
LRTTDQSVRVAFPVLRLGWDTALVAPPMSPISARPYRRPQRELAVRTALGASRSSIARLFQKSDITAAGGTMGAVLSAFAVDALLKTSDGTLPRITKLADGWS